ncbi:hypothetical protein ABT297_23430 [Dactylosporangium sp. NPDC000555]|uniref:hypothetical protein n=1 Tax=Dactylosporangium sp. NPDC000555 TaxID=3154260 RepID=UPI003332671B
MILLLETSAERAAWQRRAPELRWEPVPGEQSPTKRTSAKKKEPRSRRRPTARSSGTPGG